MTDRLTPAKIFDFLACGKPVLATPLHGMLYDFPKESNTIIYENLESFTEKMIELLKSDSLDEIGRRGREFVGKNFTWDIVTRKMLKEFDNMIKWSKSLLNPRRKNGLRMKIMSIFGTRPEIIRMSRIFELLDNNFDHVMVNTSQNFTHELNTVFFDEMRIRKPDYDMKVNTCLLYTSPSPRD